MEISRIAYQHFYKGINYPNLLPHKEEYNRKNYNKNYKYNFDDYTNFCIEKKKTFLPLNCILASGYPAREDNARFKTTVKRATIILLVKYPIKSTLCQTSI